MRKDTTTESTIEALILLFGEDHVDDPAVSRSVLSATTTEKEKRDKIEEKLNGIEKLLYSFGKNNSAGGRNGGDGNKKKGSGKSGTWRPPCRYGSKCTKQDCTFFHPKKKAS